MKRKNIEVWALGIIFLTLTVTSARAQRFHSRFVYGPAVGVMNYLGDLDDDFTFKFTKPSFGISARFQFNPNLSVRGFASYGYMSARDVVSNNFARNRRNISVRTHIAEMNVQLVFDFYGNNRKFILRPDYTPYLFAGAGIFNFNPEAKVVGASDPSLDGWHDLQPLGTEGQNVPGTGQHRYALTQPSFPIGGGLRFKLSKSIDIEGEVGWRKTFTDYLDDVSTIYYDKGSISENAPPGEGEVARLLSDPSVTGQVTGDQRGDVTDQDWYIFSGIILTMHFDGVRCPKH